MTTTTNAAQSAPTTFGDRFGTAGLSSAVRSLTKTMLGAWDYLPVGRRVPADAKLASLRADVMIGHVKPIEHMLRLTTGAIDAGVPVDRVTAFLHDAVRFLEGYAERKAQRQSLGILSFPQRIQRLWVRETREQGEADCLLTTLDGKDATTLRAALVELDDHIDSLKALRVAVADQLLVVDTGVRG